jgi:exodeoxyribonuclease-1
MYSLRKKQEVSKLLNTRTHDAVLHASSKFSAERNSIAIVIPICQHPINKNSIIVYDLNTDPADFIEISVEEVRDRLYTKTSDLAEGVRRIPLKEIHINKCPAVVPLKTMDDECAKRLDIDAETCLENRQKILDNIDALTEKVRRVFSEHDYPEITDPDAQLYSGGFFSDADNTRMERIRKSSAEELGDLHLSFDDIRLPEMLFRYRARNFPESLSDEESQRWNEYRHLKVTNQDIGHRTLNQYISDIKNLKTNPDTTDSQQVVLDKLLEYSKQLDI